MAKRFKLKISRVFAFQSCRSSRDHPSTLPSNPVPSFLRLSPANPNPITLHMPPQPPPPPLPLPTSSKPRYSLKRHVSYAFSSMGCGLGPRSSAQYLSDTDYTESPPPPTPEFHWEKNHKWHVIAKVQENETPRAKIAEGSDADDVLPPPPPPNTERKKKRRHRKKKTTTKIRVSTSSGDSGIFSSESFDDEEETESLVSPSRSISTDSSSRQHKKKRNKRSVRRCIVKEMSARLSSTSESESPARLSMFLQRMIPCAVEGKVRESFAVVKRSEDPFEDFKRSMMEMILEKQMFEEKDLEQLLQCFLSLNSRHHHGVIIQAFAQIWEALFCRRSTSFRVS
ncbi:hypothetical protein SLEP1_g12024 [Rubroshorea leprosula]|nr:hypothetical protein SLEP1_g12024 [Rubroshorea leprosula]